jgi:DNA-binding NarL/FixJ family response regulator
VGPVTVLVVSPDPLARSGVAALVAARPELALAGEAGPREAARVAVTREPQVVLWDVLEPLQGGSPWAGLAAPVVALASDPAPAGQALRAGARAVLSRSVNPELLARAVGAVAGGLLVLDPALAGGYLRPPDPNGGAEPLTPREREVLGLLAEGSSNKAIAARLGISDHTAKFHVNAILAKLGVESRAEAIVRAARLGLVTL